MSNLQRAPHYVAGTQIGHQPRQNRWQNDLSRLETGLGRGDAITRALDATTLLAVVLQEDLFTPHTSENSKSGDGIGSERGESSRGLALGSLGRVQRTHERCRQRRQNWHAQEHDESELY